MYDVQKQEEIVLCACLCSRKLILLISKELSLLQNSPTLFSLAKVLSMVLCTPIYTISIRHLGDSQVSYSPTWPKTNGFIKQTK